MNSAVSITDTRYKLETPEGADLPLEPAGMGIRIMAFVVDWLIKTGISFAMLMIFAVTNKAAYGIFLILYFLLEWFYPVLFEVFRGGQTPGKKAYKIRVVCEDGTPITFGSSLLRNLLRVVDFLPFAYLAGIVCSMLNVRFQRLGDIVAGTMVIYVPEQLKAPVIDVKGTEPVPIGFTTQEQRVLVDYTERCQFLSEARQEELAQILSPLLSSTDKVQQLKRMAKSVVDSSDASNGKSSGALNR